MNLAAAISLLTVGGGLVFATVWLRISRAPGWEAMRYFAAIAATASMYCLGDLAEVAGGSDFWVRFGTQFSVAQGSLNGICWLAWFAASQHRRLTRGERALVAAGLLLAALSMVPGVVVADRIVSFDVSWLRITYRFASATDLGVLLITVYVLGIGVAGWHTLKRSSAQHARWAVGILALLIVVGTHDTLVGARQIQSPLLMDATFFVVIVGFGLSELQRFISDARRLNALSADLEKQIQERSLQLSQAQSALARAEKLAALGQLAAGVAHEVNNPASVVKSNLEFAYTALEGESQLSDEVRSSLTDSMLATKRIAKVVRQLLDAGRNAGEEAATLLPCDPGLAIGRAVARLRQSYGKSFQIKMTAGNDTRARADIAILEQVLYNLLQNSAHAVRPRGDAGRIAISTSRSESRVLIEISDNGAGIPQELQSRLFEPFFTTKEFGEGTGLGLAVSLGLMRAQQGDLTLLESTPEGSTFVLSLAASDEDDSSLRVPVIPVKHDGLRVLVIDDEKQVRDGLRRALSKSFYIEVAAGVDEALEAIRTSQNDIDAVLCDILMPAGGGARFYQELQTVAPDLAKRTLFMTGGATSAEAQEFLARNSERVLLKPLDRDKLRQEILGLVRSPKGVT